MPPASTDAQKKQTQRLRALRWHYAKAMHVRALALKKTVEQMQKLQKTLNSKAARVLGATNPRLPLSRFDFEPWGSIERQLDDLGEVQMPGFEDVITLAETMLEETSLLTESERPMTLPYENGADNDMPEAVPEDEAAFDDDATTEEEDGEAACGPVVVVVEDD